MSKGGGWTKIQKHRRDRKRGLHDSRRRAEERRGGIKEKFR